MVYPCGLSPEVLSLGSSKLPWALKGALDTWFHEAESANWASPADVKKSYGTASIIDQERVVFNIKGNSYRLVVAIDYRRHTVFIKWIGSHKEYDQIDARKVQHAHQTDTKHRGS